MRHAATLLLLCCFLTSVITGAKKPKDEVLVNFAGSLKRITKKEIVIQTDADNEMTFVRTKRTSFQSGGRAVDGGALPQGIAVTIQAFEKLNREIEAVSVTVATPDQLPNK
jgi:hypothetical protein